MMETDLFPDTIDKTQDGASWTIGDWQFRNWRGWHQEREGGRGQWQFRISGFSGGAAGYETEAHIYRIGERGQLVTRIVQMDRLDRINVEGRKFGRSRWAH